MKAVSVNFSKNSPPIPSRVSYVYANFERRSYHKTHMPSFIFPIYGRDHISERDFLKKISENKSKLCHRLKFITPHVQESDSIKNKIIWRIRDGEQEYTETGFSFPFVNPIITPLMFALYFCKDNKIDTIIIDGIDYNQLDKDNKTMLLKFLHYGSANEVSFIEVDNQESKIPLIVSLSKKEIGKVLK